MDGNNNYSVDIAFRGEVNNLYDLGYLSNDLYQLAVFAHLLGQGEGERAEKVFGPKSRPLNRYQSDLTHKTDLARIVESKDGSTILTVGGLTLAATIIFGIADLWLPRYLDHRNAQVTFDIAVNDTNLSTVLDAYENGDFGRGQSGLDTLWAILRERGYSVNVLSDNTFLIEHVAQRYAQRMARTISKN